MFKLFRSRAALLAGVSASALSIVTAAVAQTSGPQTLDPITVLATKTEEKAIDSLAAVSTIREEQIRQILPTRLSEIFFGVPSVTFQQRGDDPATAINIRGLQDFGRVAVVVDGARQNFQTTGHNANGVFYLDPELIGGADIVRGPVANIYGSGAIGGVVSFRTKDVDDVLNFGERWGMAASAMAGSNLGRGMGSLFGAVRANPNIDVFGGAVFRSQSNYKDGDGVEIPNTSNELGAGIGKITIRPMEGHEIKLTGITQNFDFHTGQQAITTGSTTTARNESVYDARVRTDLLSARWKYSRPEDKWFDFEATAYFTRNNEDETKVLNGTPTSLGNAITGFVGDRRNFNIETTGFDIHNSTRFETGPFRHVLTYGVDGFFDKVNVVDATGTADLFTPSGKRTVDGAFAQWKASYLNWVDIIGAARYDEFKLEGGGVTNEGDRISPKITVGVNPLTWLTVYATYAEGYRAPSITETLVAGNHPPFFAFPGAPPGFTFVPNPSLLPEVGKTKEVGVNVKYDDLFTAGDKLRIKANLFRNDVDDYINPVQFGPINLFGIPAFYQYRNIANARIDGVEFESTYDAGAWFVGLSGQHLRGHDVQTNDPLLTVQPDQIAITAGLRFWDRKMSVAVRWAAVAAKNAADIPDLDRNGQPDLPVAGAYNLVNIYLGYQPTPDVTVGFAVENALNEQYFRYLDFQASPGVTYKGSLRLRFGTT